MPVPPKLKPSEVAEVITLYSNGVSQGKIAERYGVHRNTIGRIFKRLREEKDPPVLKPCGTNAAYWRHRRNGDTYCEACWTAHARDQQIRSQKPENKEKRKKWNDARYARAKLESQSTGVPIRVLLSVGKSKKAS